MIDWRIAAQVAETVASAQAAPDPTPFQAVAGPTEESERLVGAYTGLAVSGEGGGMPAAEPIERREWIDANLGSLRSVLDPVSGRVGEGLGPLRGPLSVAAGMVLAVEVGVVSGLLSQRVLGQYEFPVLEPDVPARLLYVSPNLARAAAALEAEPDELLRWVALHETTHALQFGGVAWLRPHLAGLVRELLGSVSVDASRLRLPQGADVRTMIESVREGGLSALVIGPERRETMNRLQAFMAVLEGYAEHVMDAVGADVLSDLPRLRAALEHRRQDRSGVMRLLERLLGFDLKLRQYKQGKAFCDAVVAAGGIAALNRVWASPELLPTLAEVESPALWLARTGGPAAAAA